MSRTSRPCPAFEQAIASLRVAAALAPADAERLHALYDRIESWNAGAQIEPPRRRDSFRLIISGWIYEARLLTDGRRQIFGYLLPGDLISGRHGTRTPPNVLFAVAKVESVDIPRSLATTADGRLTTLGEGLMRAVEEQEQRSYEALIRLGRYSAAERLANLFVELRDRLSQAGLARRDSFRAPLTQEHLADTLGLSVIHTNRVLKELRQAGLLSVKFGVVTLPQPERLEQLAAGAGAPIARP